MRSVWNGKEQESAIVIVDAWMWTPYVMLICLAGLRSIPDYIYEAAEVDRASKWRQFWSITLPMALPFIMLAVLFRGIENFKMFDMVNLLTSGGPGRSSSLGPAKSSAAKRAAVSRADRYADVCSPTRAALITGRNHHSNAMSCITEGSTGFPGGNGAIPFENGFLSEMLLQQGYATYAIGKWHLTPSEQISAAGPYDRWPLGRGFERFYGWLGGETNSWFPDLVYDNHPIEAPGRPEDGYHLADDMADKAIEFIRDAKVIDPDKPFFMYLAPQAGHAPHLVPLEWADRYKGVFDEGYEAIRAGILAKQIELGELFQIDLVDVPARGAGLDHVGTVANHRGT